MGKEEIIGRELEKKLLEELFTKNEKVLYLFYGRRRIGKSWLVTKFFENRDDCIFIFLKAEFELKDKQETQAYHVRKEMDSTLNHHGITPNIKFDHKTPLVWAETFNYLEKSIDLLSKTYPSKKIVIFFDELPWFYSTADQGKVFIGCLSNFWSNYVSRHSRSNDFKIFASGSATRSLLNDLLKSKGALFQNSNSRQIFPFDLKESKQFLEKRNGVKLKNEDLLRIYSAVGGVADYLKEVKVGQDPDDFIQDFYYTNSNNYNIDLNDFLESSFDGHPHHRAILDVIALNKDMTKSKITVGLGKLGMTPNSTELNTYLDELLKTGLIVETEPFYPTSKLNRKNRTNPIGPRQISAKNSRYKISDEMVLFNYYWLIGMQRNPHLKWDIVDPMHNDWKGKLFELICFKHFQYIIDAKKVSRNQEYDLHFWQNPEADIDLLSDRDKIIDIYEMKCYDNGYDFPKKYFSVIKRKRDELEKHIQSFKLSKLKFYKKKNIFVNLVTSSNFSIDPSFMGNDKIAIVIDFSKLF